MFRMTIEAQLNLDDRTIIGGVAEYDVIPTKIQIQERKYEVIGLSHGTKPPKISLEIECTEDDLKAELATACYDYTIAKTYNRKIFEETIDLLMQNIENAEKSQYIEDPLDGDQLQIIKTVEGKIRVINNFMIGAVWVESEVNLKKIFNK